ncbi:hypothetical protein AVEN_114223-1 [Araneus ventricosus]|uniref:Uncharacterized protein n=1 Tax=Araneus ventricosus TaxID=182803 RepID=A0A4Y2WVQ0_ARAVE|nr:hypothetical protein AVEN_114223-1 [Araneus ventricosus]
MAEVAELISVIAELKKVHEENEISIQRQERIEKSQEEMKNKIQGVQGMIKEVEDRVQRKIRIFEKRIRDLEIKQSNFLASPELMYAKLMAKSLTFGGQISWTVFKTQLFSVVINSPKQQNPGSFARDSRLPKWSTFWSYEKFT